MATKKTTVKKTTTKKSLPKAQTGGYSYSGTAKPTEKSNRSAVVAGIIGSAVGTAAALLGRKKKKKAKELEKKVQEDIIKENQARETKKYGGAKKKLRKAQYGERVLEGPLPEYAAKEINLWNEQYPSPSGRGFNPSGPYSIKDPRASESGLNRLRNPNYSLHHQATNEFYNQNANLLKKDKKAFNEKMKTTKPAVLSEIEKRKKITESTPARLATKPATPIQKKGGSTKTKMAKGGAVAKAKEGGDKKWIQKAINPKHKGYCTPMTKKTCTPKRKALAITLKKMAKNR